MGGRECWQLSSKPLLTRACTWGVWGSVVEIVFQCEGHFHHLLLQNQTKMKKHIGWFFFRRCSLRIQRKTHGWDASRNYGPFSHASSTAFERERERERESGVSGAEITRRRIASKFCSNVHGPQMIVLTFLWFLPDFPSRTTRLIVDTSDTWWTVFTATIIRSKL